MSRVPDQLPAFVPPQLPALTSSPPTGRGWIHEIKHDGYRTLIRVERGSARAFSRSGHEWTEKYRRIVAACSTLPCRSAMLDGEVIVQDRNGVSDFGALRSAIEKQPHRLVFFAFDLLFCNAADLRQSPLSERREWLRGLIPAHDPRSPIQFSDHFDGEGQAFFKKACEMGLEGIVSKQATGHYRSGKSKSWLKTKNMSEGEFTLLGTDVDKDGKPFAHLARWEGRIMRYAGTALLTLKTDARRQFDDRTAKLLCSRPIMPVSSSREAKWIKPELQVRVRHLQGSKPLRHATVRELLT